MNSVITLVSDYGPGSPYTAAMLGSALRLMPQAQVIEISHHIPPYNISQAAFLLKSVYQNFPLGTCHLICVDCSISLYKQYLIAEYKGHYFIAADNGIFALLFDSPPEKVYKILDGIYGTDDLFPEKNVFLPVVTQFLQTGDINGLAEPGKILNEKMNVEVLVEDDKIRGTILYVDGYHNAITNIHKSVFEEAGKGRPFKLYYWGKHFLNRISEHFIADKDGDDLLLYNENGYLMISIFKGKGAQLLGLKPESKVMVEFESEPEI